MSEYTPLHNVKNFFAMATLNDFVNTQGVQLVDTALEDIDLLKRNEPDEVELRQLEILGLLEVPDAR